MLKIGILLKDSQCNKHLFNCVSQLEDLQDVELYYLINKQTTSQNEQKGFGKFIKTIKGEGFVRFLDKLSFKIVTQVEFKALSFVYKHFAEENQVFSLQPKKDYLHYLNPLFSPSGLVVRYPNEDIAAIEALQLDMIIRGNAPGIFKGKILFAAKEGIISFHHGDNRWNRGGPPGFWEVFHRKASTGFIIQQLSEELDGGRVIYRGNLQTQRTYAENIVTLFNLSYPHLIQLIQNYIKEGSFLKVEEKRPYQGIILKTPKWQVTSLYVFKTLRLFISHFFKRMLLRRHYRWGVAFLNNNWEEAILHKGTVIENPKNHFLADPFVVEKNGQSICFLEDYNYTTKRGNIAAVELKGKKGYSLLGTVINEAFHLSFPYCFEFENTLYMIPETAEAKSLRIYKCIEFPMQWELEKELFRGTSYVDPMIFEANGKWYLFVNDEKDLSLHIFYAEDPLSNDWHPHKLNPVNFNSENARNAGLLKNAEGIWVRVRQKQDFGAYGKSFSLAQIEQLSPTSFSEKEIATIQPEFLKSIERCHHMHSNGLFTAFDFCKNEKIK